MPDGAGASLEEVRELLETVIDHLLALEAAVEDLRNEVKALTAPAPPTAAEGKKRPTPTPAEKAAATATKPAAAPTRKRTRRRTAAPAD